HQKGAKRERIFAGDGKCRFGAPFGSGLIGRRRSGFLLGRELSAADGDQSGEDTSFQQVYTMAFTHGSKSSEVMRMGCLFSHRNWNGLDQAMETQASVAQALLPVLASL